MVGLGRAVKTWSSLASSKWSGLATHTEFSKVEMGGELWTLEVGQPWRNARAGLEDGDLSEGVEIRAIGEPSADASERRLKVERFFIGDQEYVLYPDRD